MRWPWHAPAPEPEAAAPVAASDLMVSSPNTLSQILDYVSGTGSVWPLDLYSVGAGGTAGGAMNFATFFRCISLLSAIAAQVITSHGLRVVGPDGKRRTGYKAGRATELLTSSPNGIDPAYTFIEDVMSDLLIDGNALVRAEMVGGRVSALRRLSPIGADVVQGRDGSLSYRAFLADEDRGGADGSARQVWTAAQHVVHARWPMIRGSWSGRGSRFATAPVVAIRPALEIGVAGDNYIRDWFASGGAHKAQIGITYPQRLNAEQRDQMAQHLAKYRGSTDPIVIGGGGTFQNLGQRVQNSESAALRSYQVRDVARIYGVPGPLLGEDVTAWGSGIEQLAKLAWRFGAKQHVDRLLAALSFRLLDRRHRFEIDDVELLRGSAVEIAQLITSTVGDSQRPTVATVAEARKWLGLPADEPPAETRPVQMAGGENEPENTHPM